MTAQPERTETNLRPTVPHVSFSATTNHRLAWLSKTDLNCRCGTNLAPPFCTMTAQPGLFRPGGARTRCVMTYPGCRDLTRRAHPQQVTPHLNCHAPASTHLVKAGHSKSAEALQSMTVQPTPYPDCPTGKPKTCGSQPHSERDGPSASDAYLGCHPSQGVAERGTAKPTLASAATSSLF